MFETALGSMLATWRLPNWPPLADDIATPLPDHRREYLEYEGEIPGNRGHVSRITAGIYRLLSRENGYISIELDGGARISLPRFSL